MFSAQSTSKLNRSKAAALIHPSAGRDWSHKINIQTTVYRLGLLCLLPPWMYKDPYPKLNKHLLQCGQMP